MSLAISDKEIADLVVDAANVRKDQPGIRIGQAFFNLLRERFPEQANIITGKPYDPFYDDDNLAECITHLQNGTFSS